MQYFAKKIVSRFWGMRFEIVERNKFEVSCQSLRICPCFCYCFSRHQFNFYVLENISRLRHPSQKGKKMINKLRFIFLIIIYKIIIDITVYYNLVFITKLYY